MGNWRRGLGIVRNGRDSGGVERVWIWNGVVRGFL